MAKRSKMKFTIPSFQFQFQLCRSKDLSSFPGNPVPAIYRLSPVNPKAHHKSDSINDQCKVSSIRSDKEKTVKLPKGRKSTSSIPSRRSDFLVDSINEEESETLISCLTSFSDELCHDENVHNKTENKADLISEKKISSLKKVKGVRFHSTLQQQENRKGAETTVNVSSTASSMRWSSVDQGKVKESFAVVRKSKDPYEDFKKSMVEMIAEMEMSEAEDLEQLLQCFLALNSRSYHAVIVRAFMEIWQQMFVWNPRTSSIKNLQTQTGVKTDTESQ